MFKFFLGAKGASLAFLKEEESPDWASSILRTVATADLPDTPPADNSDPDVMDTSTVRTGGFIAQPSEGSATYGITVYGWYGSSKSAGDTPMADFYKLDNGTWTDLTGNNAFGVDCQLYEGFIVVVDSLSAGYLSIEQFVIPYEDGSQE